MAETGPDFISVGTGPSVRRIAYQRETGRGGAGPGLFWLSGFKSDMTSTKATALAGRAAKLGVDCVRFDYSGHGASEGAFEQGTIGRWLEEAETVFTRISRGPQVVVGSSMGGHIALMLLKRLMERAPADAARITALVLIAPAWDMTEELMWRKFPESARKELAERGVYYEPSNYGEPYTITRDLIEEGRHHLLARTPFDPGRPVIILQGLQDPDVPADHTRELLTFLTGNHVQLIEIADGDHRLSRPQDLETLFGAISTASRAAR